MGTGRRLTVLLLALALIGIPAAVLRIGCVGASCRSDAAAVAAPAPFCSSPTDLRTLITAGYVRRALPRRARDRGLTPVVSGGVPWPSEASSADAGAVELDFVGRGIRNTRLPPGVSLDQVAPTLEPLLGLHRAHPEVRAGTAIPGVVRNRTKAPLVVLVVSKGIGRSDMRAIVRGRRSWAVGRSNRVSATHRVRRSPVRCRWIRSRSRRRSVPAASPRSTASPARTSATARRQGGARLRTRVPAAGDRDAR